MGAILAYVIQSTLCVALLFIGYCLLGMKRETFHRFNRAVLLGICALAFLLPWGSDMWEGHVTMQSAESDWNAWLAHAAADEESVPSTPSSRTFPVWQMALLTIYVVGSCVLVVRYLRGWRRLRAVLRNGRCIRLDDKTRLVLHDKEMASFSWMGYVVMSEADYETHGKLILAHELAHVRLRHSWDMLFVSICAVVQWFNPCVWLLRRELQAVHEYEVDEAVLRQGIEERQYQLLLIEKAVGTRRYSMVNSFNHSSLNKRITMMKKKNRVHGHARSICMCFPWQLVQWPPLPVRKSRLRWSGFRVSKLRILPQSRKRMARKPTLWLPHRFKMTCSMWWNRCPGFREEKRQ